MDSNAPTATYTGSCHCGQVKYEVTLPEVAHWQLSRCNCTICHKKGYLGLLGKAGTLKLLSPSNESELGDYTFGTGKMHHYFCKNCGTGTHVLGHVEALGGDFVMVSAHAIDDVDLSKMKIGKYWNGREEKWADGPSAEPVKPGAW